MFSTLEDFKWVRYPAYKIVMRRWKGPNGPAYRNIHPTANEGVEYHPHRERPNLFHLFADIRDQEHLMDFVRQYGLLYPWSVPPPIRFDEIEFLLKFSDWIREILHAQQQKQSARVFALLKGRKSLVQATETLMHDPANGLHLRRQFKLNSLADLIKAQVSKSCVAGDMSRSCKHCERWFAAKPNAFFCRPACRVSYHNQLKRKER